MNKLVTSTIGKGLNILSYIAPEKTGEIGFNLFCHPVRPALSDKHKQFLLDAKWQSLTIQGQQIQVYKWGKGPARVLFAHGWQSHSYRWKPYIEQMDLETYTIYAVDAPAHGLSTGKSVTVPYYGEVVHVLGKLVGTFHAMVGHSFGSFTLLYTLKQYPDMQPRKLILLAPPASASDFLDFYKEILQLSDRTMQLTVDHFTQKLEKSPDYFKAADFAETLRVGGLLIHDQEDKETPVENSEEIHAVWPASELVITEGFGHNLRSPEVVKRVVSYLSA